MSQSKKKAKPEVIIDRNTRNKKKCVTTVFGLDSFGIKLQEAAKCFAKKYAGGAAVTKTPTDKEQIDVQVCCGLHVGQQVGTRLHGYMMDTGCAGEVHMRYSRSSILMSHCVIMFVLNW